MAAAEEAMARAMAGLAEALRQQMLPAFDVRSLGRLQEFSGKDQDWQLWSFVLEAHVALLA